jgi:hypothetical protein
MLDTKRVPNIERLHSNWEKLIKLATSYIEIPEMSFIIQSCRLKPFDLVLGKNKNKRVVSVILHRHWFDEFGNSLMLKWGKKIEIVYNDLSVPKTQIVSTDLYRGLSIENIVKISTCLHLIVGKDEDLQQPCYLMTLYGIDQYLRSFIFWHGKWQQVSPLWLGLDSLIELEDLRKDTWGQYQTLKNLPPLPCTQLRGWLGYVGDMDDWLQMLEKEGYNEITQFLCSEQKD